MSKMSELDRKMREIDECMDLDFDNPELSGDKSHTALDIQDEIQSLIDKLDKYGFEFMYYNRISSIRRKRDG